MSVVTVVVRAVCCDLGGVSDFGLRIKLKMTSIDDLSRDVLKVLSFCSGKSCYFDTGFLYQSETASVIIPALDLEVQSSSMGGKFTTLEGLVDDIKQQVDRLSPCICHFFRI